MVSPPPSSSLSSPALSSIFRSGWVGPFPACLPLSPVSCVQQGCDTSYFAPSFPQSSSLLTIICQEVNISSYFLLNLNPNALRPSKINAQRAVSLLTATAVILRGEVALLLVPICFQLLDSESITPGTLMRTICMAGIVSVGECRHAPVRAFRSTIDCVHLSITAPAITVSVDSYFWSRWFTWPELYVLSYNIRQERHSEWGVSSPCYTKYR